MAFPRDLGPHEEYQTEWWYYTGNLATAEGRPFGYQFTIFRRALAPSTELAQDSNVEWRSNQLYFAHFTISDIGDDAFYANERFSREAGAGRGAVGTIRGLVGRLVGARNCARADALAGGDSRGGALDLVLTETMAPVFHGDGGLSQKGPEPGNASYYYSIIRQAKGTVRVGEQTLTSAVWAGKTTNTRRALAVGRLAGTGCRCKWTMAAG